MTDRVPELSLEDLQRWVGREERMAELLSPIPARGFAALLDRDPEQVMEGSVLAEGWHWFYLYSIIRRSEWGEDGHPQRGGFLPPVPLPRRMWVGGRIRFHEPLRIGERAERHSVVESLQQKDGRSGRFALVGVRHRVSGPSGLAVEEEQDLAYREALPAGAAWAGSMPVPQGAEWSEEFRPDPVVLFRFSALTGNGHRIHYDHPYTTGMEGYPGLVVHGPLTALLLLETARARTGQTPRSFTYRAVSPLFVGEPLVLAGSTNPVGRSSELWASGPRGLVMQGTVGW